MNLTKEERKRLERIYHEHLSGGFQTCTGLVCVDGKWVNGTEDWHRRVKEEFGEDSELTKYLLRPRPEGFITGK